VSITIITAHWRFNDSISAIVLIFILKLLLAAALGGFWIG
jgi:hypothetical protein